MMAMKAVTGDGKGGRENKGSFDWKNKERVRSGRMNVREMMVGKIFAWREGQN
jgi:hypothetical protein